MYTIKGGWVGQAFALASCNDSGGKKTRIRRSKEERKSMVESFIKRYQSLNHGSFPSLNLTHKEVGGSFYTVREIVREIIQENRVLGPAKLYVEEQNFDAVSVEYPLGSLSLEPQNGLLHVENEHQVVPDHKNNLSCVTEISPIVELGSTSKDQASILELTLNGYGQFSSHLCLEDAQFDNDSHIEEPDEMADTESIGAEASETNQQPEQIGLHAHELTNPTADIAVETFPLRPIAEDTVILDASLNGSNTMETVEQVEIQEVDSEKAETLMGSMESVDHSSAVLNRAEGGDPALPMSESKPCISNCLPVVNVKEKSLQVPDPLTTSKANPIAQDSSDFGSTILHSNVATKTIDESLQIAAHEPKGSINGSTIFVASKESTSEKQVLANDVAGVLSENNPTLDRINLECWEGGSRKSSKQEANPLLAFLKAFVSAFLQFWTE